jgi:hypothetical protein
MELEAALEAIRLSNQQYVVDGEITRTTLASSSTSRRASAAELNPSEPNSNLYESFFLHFMQFAHPMKFCRLLDANLRTPEVPSAANVVLEVRRNNSPPGTWKPPSGSRSRRRQGHIVTGTTQTKPRRSRNEVLINE